MREDLPDRPSGQGAWKDALLWHAGKSGLERPRIAQHAIRKVASRAESAQLGFPHAGSLGILPRFLEGALLAQSPIMLVSNLAKNVAVALSLAALGSLVACSAEGNEDDTNEAAAADDIGRDDDVVDEAAFGSTSDEVRSCAAPKKACGGKCASLANDIENCGACGHRCGGLRACVSGQCVLQKQGVVSVLYLTPQGQKPNAARVDFFRAATKNVQSWYQKAYGKTFNFTFGRMLAKHPIDWFRCEKENTFNECFAQVGAELSERGIAVYDPGTLYLVALQGNDAHYAGSGTGNAGLTVVGADTFDKLIKRGCAPGTCPVGGQDGDGITGGIAHELGHAFGLPHPADATPNRSTSLMAEHWHYPRNVFLPMEMASLRQNALVSSLLTR